MNNIEVFDSYDKVLRYIETAEKIGFGKKSSSYRDVKYLHHVNKESNISDVQINRLRIRAYKTKIMLLIFNCN